LVVIKSCRAKGQDFPAAKTTLIPLRIIPIHTIKIFIHKTLHSFQQPIQKSTTTKPELYTISQNQTIGILREIIEYKKEKITGT
jgi:hypothetical protein